MKSLVLRAVMRIAVVSMCLFVPISIHAEQSGDLKVASALICKNVVNREPLDAGTRFAYSVGRLYCFSHIAGIRNPTEVVHVWRYGEAQRARVKLEVNPPNWRTYSSKIIQAHEKGTWNVEILDANGNRLDMVRFEITD